MLIFMFSVRGGAVVSMTAIRTGVCFIRFAGQHSGRHTMPVRLNAWCNHQFAVGGPDISGCRFFFIYVVTAEIPPLLSKVVPFLSGGFSRRIQNNDSLKGIFRIYQHSPL
ncbi:hypothetical protein DVE38_07750 [Salmonella enterica]|nr:hypothetical protein [Salmonella enterica]